MSATVQGMIARDNVVILPTVAVTNHTSAAIYLAGTCSHVAIDVAISSAHGGFFYDEYARDFCPADELGDILQPIAAGDTYTFPRSHHDPGAILLSHVARLQGASLAPGVYTVTATVYRWHQGTLDQFLHATPTPLYGSASAQTTVTIT